MAQVCHRCGALVPDGAASCPHCHAVTEVTQKIAVGDLTWCPSCGALVPPADETCPKCGTLVRPAAASRPVRDLDLPEIDDESEPDSSRTGVMTRIESAIPPAADASSPAASRDRMPRPRAFAFAAIFAVAIVGGAALLITHPWDPTASITRASEPADTSMSGYPGSVDALSGQDRERDKDQPVSADAFDLIESAYERLSELEGAVGESETLLRETCGEGDAEALADGLEDAQAVSLDVSNLISDIERLGDDDGTYAEDVEHLLTLGNWLRNRCDVLTEAWRLAAESDDPSSVSSQVVSALTGGRDYARLFDQNYDDWRPERAG